ncbi:similar to RIKEN cDNA 4732496G21 gene [Rattus norvegicus]|uniref:Centrosomal protein of 95 kDa n=4 Tax=Rattus norvegicus TaxID=10116 RepID=CEP95_RAT|nr:centrosomal protein of 95 kDa [Rattus norvegicus]Q5XI03.1 RecName: Full=Centrosomal protein of 95 kDa; Short=Cep95; AltName: Full=Coiled-coil domain-containing protein 45 [Rattus norvegicus]AAH83896.1 Coiled-coil domain containing 45 [Rattus norvegicus]EDM06416.1 similar to RIKEN cDNA 4732496G21 gene [Rattus norvegicus]|eukprot:NP_001013884.1 centrosomal protein of 95 kDa [Rattus norvegicus]
MASSEAEWVTIANNLLFKCHIHLRIHKLQDCDANVFIALYQSILGEKVPDLIVIPRSQEDNAHNVQAVIDSLALDYLQVSLSHITGENIVKGDKGSIKNLLEIFDGLLEYLTEHISESSHNRSASEQFCRDSRGEEPVEELESAKESSWRKVPFMRCSFSPDALGPTWDEEEAESTGEIIRLGDTAHTFSLRSNGAQNSMNFWSRKASTSGIRPPEEMLNPGLSSFLFKNGPTCEEEEAPPIHMATSARKLGEPIRAAIPLHPPYHPPEPRAPCPIGKEYLCSGHYLSTPASGEHRAPSVEPGDVFLTSTLCKDDDQETDLDLTESSKTRRLSKGERSENRAVAPSEYPPFPQKARKRLTEQELHAMSEKLSQRLSELDWMLKTALGDRATGEAHGKDGGAGDEEAHSANEEMLSQHSDSVMEYGPRKPRPGFSMHRKAPYRSHSLSPSSVNKHRQSEKERKKQHKSKGTDTHHFQAKALTEAFERELRKNKVQENVGLRGIREEEEETEKSYKEAFAKGTTKQSQVQKIYSRKTAAPTPKGGLLKSSKASPMKVNEHSLLSLMLEQFPFLYVSDPTLTKMWKQQMAQVEQLRREAQRENRSKKKLQDEIEEALRRHDLLTALVKKEYDHNKRLQDFKDRIHKQRLTQSKIKENRHQSVRARKYYDDYRVQLRAKMMKMRTREEMIFKKLFEEGLQIQKQRLRDLRNYAKEKRSEEKRQHQNELDSMENYYKDQFSLLAEAISQGRQELKARQRSQAQTLHKVKRELRAKMEKEIEQLQHLITQSDDDAFFRELEAERFKARLQLASFQYSKNPFPRGQTP